MSKADSACMGGLIIPDVARFSLFVTNLFQLTYCFFKEEENREGERLDIKQQTNTEKGQIFYTATAPEPQVTFIGKLATYFIPLIEECFLGASGRRFRWLLRQQFASCWWSFCSGLSVHDIVGIPDVGIKQEPAVSKLPPLH